MPRARLSTSTRKNAFTKASLAEAVRKNAELPLSVASTIVDLILEQIVFSLRRGDKVEIRGFGSFRTRQRRAHAGRNPATGAHVDVPAKMVPFFKPSKDLRELLNPEL